ncbi:MULTISPECIES: hypothetical protein [unclassified Enterococcus]|uniref:hypothetical protein n=1 Tax=unclassified Enterococcus TaxID=2608891 RepID=UPI001556BF66|nr:MULTISPECIES: hypothetical protein [unclassified Enterococcus]MBS7578314.1 hypothetical protein [Enterococcus sp. MMGLQ5-2]MBS7585475.1 hypothetical protein [Enterococcus sp. MMGLQ5-1]NPD13332.1 hypothetical protein [Enterococcus sp. MMGLQ5-1]NPD38145.1 hypothetical protein [Enterococcus sp. MMGLQ5-2]
MSEYEKMIENINPTIQDVIKDIDHCKLGIFPAGVITGNYETFLSSYQVKKVLEYLANPKLNDKQQIVLEWLKEKNNNLMPLTPFNAIMILGQPILSNKKHNVRNSLDSLNTIEQAQVLQAFSAWVIEQEGE